MLLKLRKKRTGKEVPMSKSPYNDLQEIARRKEALRKEIKQQETQLSHDFDAYQEDVDTLKHVWNRIVSMRKLRERSHVDNIASTLGSYTKKPALVTAITVGAKLIRWLWKRKK